MVSLFSVSAAIRRDGIRGFVSLAAARMLMDPLRLRWLPSDKRVELALPFLSSPEYAEYRNQGHYIEEIKDLANQRGLGFWIGPEHPAMGRYLGQLVTQTQARAVLEVGYLCGGAAIPIIEKLNDNASKTSYLGIDLELESAGAGFGSLLADYVRVRGLTRGESKFVVGDAERTLGKVDSKFDLILIDHAKDRYSSTLDVILGRGLYHESSLFLFHDIYSYAFRYMNNIYRRFAFHIGIPRIREGLAICAQPRVPDGMVRRLSDDE